MRTNQIALKPFPERLSNADLNLVRPGVCKDTVHKTVAYVPESARATKRTVPIANAYPIRRLAIHAVSAVSEINEP